MAVSLSSIKDLLLPGLMDVTGQYEKIPPQWQKVFTKKKSNMALERTVSVRFQGLAQLKLEGAPTAFDNNAGERFVYNMEPVEVGLGYAMTRKAIADNLYKTQFKPTNLDLQKSFADFKEIEAAAIFNSCTTVTPGLGGDGQPLASTAHPVDGTTWGNTPVTQLDLNEASLLSSMTAIRRNFVNEAGLKIKARARKLIGPPELEQVMIRLTKTVLRPGTANNDVNAVLSLSGGLADGYEVMDYLTSPYAWFLKTDVDGLIYIERENFEMSMWVDDYTDNLMVKGYERYGFFYNDPRAIYCNTPLS